MLSSFWRCFNSQSVLNVPETCATTTVDGKFRNPKTQLKSTQNGQMTSVLPLNARLQLGLINMEDFEMHVWSITYIRQDGERKTP